MTNAPTTISTFTTKPSNYFVAIANEWTYSWRVSTRWISLWRVSTRWSYWWFNIIIKDFVLLFSHWRLIYWCVFDTVGITYGWIAIIALFRIIMIWSFCALGLYTWIFGSLVMIASILTVWVIWRSTWTTSITWAIRISAWITSWVISVWARIVIASITSCCSVTEGSSIDVSITSCIFSCNSDALFFPHVFAVQIEPFL